MSATIINYDSDEATAAWSGPTSSASFNFFGRLGVPGSGGRCPTCSSIIYSRRHELCSVCGGHLPEKCRFTTQEARRVESLFVAERSRHRAWLRKVSSP